MTVEALRKLIDGAQRWREDTGPGPDGCADGVEPARWALPPAITLDELRVARLTPRCIVENYLFADVATLIAPGSTGKTTLTLFEAVHIALGKPLWGLRVVHPGSVLIVTAEDRREYLVARLREICIALNLSASERACVLDRVRIDDRTSEVRRLTVIAFDAVMAGDFANDIVLACKAAGFAPALVQFDPMVSFGIGEARVNDAEQALIEAARLIANGLDCCVRYVHHTGKGPALDKRIDQYTGRGGSALADGARMVAVMAALDAAELLTATDERLADTESAFALHRPKVSYAPPQRSPIYVRRRGYSFEMLCAKAAQTTDERAATLGQQIARFLDSELLAGRKHTRHTLEDLKPDSLSRQDVRTGLTWLLTSSLLCEVDVIGLDGKKPAKGARTYLRPLFADSADSGEPTARRAA